MMEAILGATKVCEGCARPVPACDCNEPIWTYAYVRRGDDKPRLQTWGNKGSSRKNAQHWRDSDERHAQYVFVGLVQRVTEPVPAIWPTPAGTGEKASGPIYCVSGPVYCGRCAATPCDCDERIWTFAYVEAVSRKVTLATWGCLRPGQCGSIYRVAMENRPYFEKCASEGRYLYVGPVQRASEPPKVPAEFLRKYCGDCQAEPCDCGKKIWTFRCFDFGKRFWAMCGTIAEARAYRLKRAHDGTAAGPVQRHPDYDTTSPVVVVDSIAIVKPPVEAQQQCALSWCKKMSTGHYCSTFCADIDTRRRQHHEREHAFVIGKKELPASERDWASNMTAAAILKLKAEWQALRHAPLQGDPSVFKGIDDDE